MKVDGSVALVTGANRGLGAAFCRTLLDRGAAKVYAGVRDSRGLTSTVWSPSSSGPIRRRRPDPRRPGGRGPRGPGR